MKKSLQQRIDEVTSEEISIVPYNPQWPILFEREAKHLRKILPENLIKRVEHFGSTAVPGLSAKPIIDMLIEVSSLDDTKEIVVPILEAKGYDYFWRPTIGNEGPYYAWFIKRNAKGERTHHLHMVEADSGLWNRLYFVKYLKEFPNEARKYDELKRELSARFPNDRVAYTKTKTDFITALTKKALAYYRVKNS